MLLLSLLSLLLMFIAYVAAVPVVVALTVKLKLTYEEVVTKSFRLNVT